MPEHSLFLGVEVHRFHSEILDLDLEIYVQKPPIELPEPPPVLVGTDGNLAFGLLRDTANLLLGGGEIPPVLTVAIGYDLRSDPAYAGSRRMFDFSPVADEWQIGELRKGALMSATPEPIRGGNAARFFEFIESELGPWIATNYSTSEDRTYLGDSMGGLFGTYVLLNHHGFFRRYILGSPWYCWARPLVFDYEEAYARDHADLDAKVFLAAGGAENVLAPAFDPAGAEVFRKADVSELTRRMGDALAARNYPSLDLRTRIFEEETHFTVPGIVFAHGLRFVFQNEREGA